MNLHAYIAPIMMVSSLFTINQGDTSDDKIMRLHALFDKNKNEENEPNTLMTRYVP